MFNISKDDILLIKSYEGLEKRAVVVNYFVSPIDNETVYLLKDCNSNSQGLFEESRIIGKVKLKNNKQRIEKYCNLKNNK